MTGIRLRGWWGWSAPGAGVLAGLLVILLAAMILSGCGPARPRAVALTVTNWPAARPTPRCSVLPLPATVVALPPLDPDVARVYVTRRDWEDLAVYTAQVHDWMMSVEQCLAVVAPSVGSP